METKIILRTIFLGAIAIFLCYYLFRNWSRVRNFLRDVRTEMQKVSWSSRKELLASTWIVIVSVFLLTLFIGVIDFVISQIVDLVIR